jgi:hypothetical protein
MPRFGVEPRPVIAGLTVEHDLEPVCQSIDDVDRVIVPTATTSRGRMAGAMINVDIKWLSR